MKDGAGDVVVGFENPVWPDGMLIERMKKTRRRN